LARKKTEEISFSHFSELLTFLFQKYLISKQKIYDSVHRSVE